jgi:hypothetical protein
MNNKTTPKYWLATCVTRLIDGDYADHESYCIVIAPDILAAENEALRLHVPEGFNEETGLPWTEQDYEEEGAEDYISGKWITCNGFRAFELDGDRPQVDANNIFFIRHLREISREEAAVYEKITATPTVEEEKAQLAARNIKEKDCPPCRRRGEEPSDDDGVPRRSDGSRSTADVIKEHLEKLNKRER